MFNYISIYLYRYIHIYFKRIYRKSLMRFMMYSSSHSTVREYHHFCQLIAQTYQCTYKICMYYSKRDISYVSLNKKIIFNINKYITYGVFECLNIFLYRVLMVSQCLWKHRFFLRLSRKTNLNETGSLLKNNSN